MDETAKTLRLVDQLLKTTTDPDLQERARQIRDRITLPMDKVLAKVAGATVIDRAKLIGISRATYYAWLYGRARPNPTQAIQLAKLTGFDAGKIRGRKMVEPQPKRAKRAPA